MQSRSGNEIREMFLRFFETKGHRRVHSSSLVPANDPTLLFTNAGMNQFKDVFLGLEQRDYSRATTSQKCVRAGGKHNDLENVGFTRRHHTFFEMLGNFSFGDYFKKEAIAYAWELVTSPEWFGIPKDRLYVTIFKGENGVPRDEEAYNLWLAQGVPADRIHEYGMKDNFWQMGDTGPCGPCSEIFYDMGIEASETGEDRPFGQDDSRYVEIWNLVFMQFDRNAQGELNLLPKPSIDTGAGLERMAAVLQGKISNFETDLFTPLIERAAELTGHSAGNPAARQTNGSVLTGNASLRIIADHARAATFLISDGVLPSNEGRGYVLRKILRRGIRHGRLLGQEKPFMCQMVFAVRDEMQNAYPELKESADRVSKVIEAEERQFARVLEVGSRQLQSALQQGSLDGKTAFHLYETYGLPLDFMMDAARDAGAHFDLEGFERARAEVSGCTKPVQGIFAHKTVLRQPLKLGDKVDTVVDGNFRAAVRRNHTGTHLLHAALREVLGKHVKQAGSLVEPNRLRFDFSHFTSIADEELQDIEDLINKEVLANTPVQTLEDVPIDVAINEYHAMALFGEKYGEKVRVVKIGDFSTELCGGTHTGATGEIGVVKLLGEGSVSSGVRRVEAVTGFGALHEFRRDFAVAQLASQLAPNVDLSPAEALRQRLSAQEEELKKLRRELEQMRMKSAASAVSDAASQAIEVNGIKVLAQRVDSLDRGQMRTLVDNLRQKLGSGVVVLGSAQEEGKVALIVGVTKDLTGKVQAGKLVGQIAKIVGGSGGGRPDMAEAGGKDAAQLDAALQSASKIVAELAG
jgi:alanyl-tRNA synthetase